MKSLECNTTNKQFILWMLKIASCSIATYIATVTNNYQTGWDATDNTRTLIFLPECLETGECSF